MTFRSGRKAEVEVSRLPKPMEIAGSWVVQFDSAVGASPQAAAFDALQSWSTHPDDEIKYFSGTATFRKEVTLPAASLGEDRRGDPRSGRGAQSRAFERERPGFRRGMDRAVCVQHHSGGQTRCEPGGDARRSFEVHRRASAHGALSAESNE